MRSHSAEIRGQSAVRGPRQWFYLLLSRLGLLPYLNTVPGKKDSAAHGSDLARHQRYLNDSKKGSKMEFSFCHSENLRYNMEADLCQEYLWRWLI